MTQALQRASWIWRKGEVGQDEFCDFLAMIAVPEVGKRYFLHISADSNYALYINGIWVESGQYPDFPHYKIYDELDITAHCKAGINHLAITVWHYGKTSDNGGSFS